MDQCPICNQQAATCCSLANVDGTEVVCAMCGEFSCTEEAVQLLNAKSSRRRGLRVHVSASLREITERRRAGGGRDATPMLATSRATVSHAIGLDDLLATFPKSVQDRLDILLQNLVMRSVHPGAAVVVDANKDYPLAYCENLIAFIFLLTQLRADNLITLPLQFTSITTQEWSAIHAIVTPTGWNKFAELQRGKTGSKPLQAFVAMWMERGRRAEWEPGLRQGVERAGYQPMVIDQVDYIGSISDRIIAEIRQSRLVVADFTGHRPNVYFEAGFAEGLGIPTFYTCHQSDIENLHFDKRQENTIDWADPAGLADRLHRRIEAVLGRPPQQFGS